MILRISQTIFLLFIVLLSIVTPFITYMFGMFIPYTDFIFPFALGFWLLALFKGQTKIRISKFYYFLAFYAFALSISTVFSINPKQSFYKLLGEFYLLSLCVLTFNLVRSLDFLKKLTFAWLVGTGLTVLGAFAGFVLFYMGYKTMNDNFFLHHYGTLPVGNYPRIQSMFIRANVLCNFLNISLMLTLLAGKLNWLTKFWRRFLLFGIWFAAFFALSPGFGGLTLSLGFWLRAIFNFTGRRSLANFACFSGVLIAVLFFASALFSLDTQNTEQDFKLPFIEQKIELSIRVLVWQDSLKTIEEHALIGKGTGTEVAAVEYVVFSGDNQYLTDAHNVWLNQLGQLGVFGFVAFASLCLFLLWNSKIYIADTTDKSFVQLSLTCAFLGAFWFQGLQGSYENARHIWVLFGLLVSFGEADFDQSNN